MNKNLFITTGAILPVVIWLLGCASERTKQPAISPHDTVHALQPERRLTEVEILRRAPSQSALPVGGEGWRPMFDGESLNGWRVTDFTGRGAVECWHGFILFRAGDPFTGITWTNDVPKVNYEITLEAMRVSGSDFFCALIFPVRESFCSLVVGGWGGTLVGLSNLDDMDASENETTQLISFEDGRWYRIRLRVTEQKIEAWIEQKKVVDLVTTGRKFSLPPGEVERSKPLGIASWMTSAALRGMEIRHVNAPDSSEP